MNQREAKKLLNGMRKTLAKNFVGFVLAVDDDEANHPEAMHLYMDGDRYFLGNLVKQILETDPQIAVYVQKREEMQYERT